MRITLEKKEKIIENRKKGLSIPQLSEAFGVSKSTASRLVKNIEILPEYRQQWLQRRNASQIISERATKEAEKLSFEVIPSVNRQIIGAVLASLYWAEGTKKDFSFCNGDPEMVRVFITSLKKVFFVKNEDIKVSIRIYEDLNLNECIEHWSKVVGFSLAGKVSINVLKGKKTGKLKYGMCRIRVKKAGLLLKTIFAINKRVHNLIISS